MDEIDQHLPDERTRHVGLAQDYGRLSVALARAGRGAEALAAQVVADGHRWAGALWGRASGSATPDATFAQLAATTRPARVDGRVRDGADAVTALREHWGKALQGMRVMAFDTDISHLKGLPVPGPEQFAALVLGGWDAREYLAGPGAQEAEQARAAIVQDALDTGDEAMVGALARVLLAASGQGHTTTHLLGQESAQA